MTQNSPASLMKRHCANCVIVLARKIYAISDGYSVGTQQGLFHIKIPSQFLSFPHYYTIDFHASKFVTHSKVAKNSQTYPTKLRNALQVNV